MKAKMINHADLRSIIAPSDGAVLLFVKGDRYSVVSWGRTVRWERRMKRVAADLSDAIMAKHIDLQE